MSKASTILALVAAASAEYASSWSGVASVPASSAAPVSGSAEPSWVASASYSSVALPVSGSASYSVSYVASASAIPYPSGSATWAPASSSAVYSSAVYSSAAPAPTPTCWAKCFEEAGITAESQLCGNVEVDECITEECCQEESWAYWQWYESYCPAPSSTSPPVYSTAPVYSSASAVPSSPVDTCWTDCFAKYDVTSEAELCGDDEVSACIHETCSPALDKAYWEWYTGFCVAATTSVITYTTYYTPTTADPTPYTTTWEVTSEYGWGPSEPTATGVPVPPAPPAPYTTYAPSPVSPVATGAGSPTGYAPGATTTSAWSPVPATGAGAVTKPGVFLALAMAVAALF